MKPLAYYQEQTKRPGKFEGENPLTVFIWEESLDGSLEFVSDQENGGVWAEKIRLTPEEQEQFGTGVSEWIIVEDSQGFVMSMPADRFEEWRG
jgi:hypothetical protein